MRFPHLNFAPLENAISGLQKSADSFRDAKKQFMNADKKISAEKIKQLNDIIYRSERALNK